MPTDNYPNYIKHLESIIQMHENATKAPDGWVYSDNAHGILARAESAIRKICSDGSPYKERMEEILKTAFTDEPVKAGLIVGIVKALKVIWRTDTYNRSLNWLEEKCSKT